MAFIYGKGRHIGASMTMDLPTKGARNRII